MQYIILNSNQIHVINELVHFFHKFYVQTIDSELPINNSITSKVW